MKGPISLMLLALMFSLPLQKVDDNAKINELYRNNCMICHGQALEGGFGPELLHVGARRTKAQIVEIITNGGTLMPAFRNQLDVGTINALAEWLSTKK